MPAAISSLVPDLRVRALNSLAPSEHGEYVLYWMTSNRRVRANFALQRAIDWALALQKPLIVLEALRSDYPWASDRFHQFVIEGMQDNLRMLTSRPVTYYPYVEPSRGAGRGMMDAWAERACVIVGDDFPCFFLPRMQEAVADRVQIRFEVVDSNGILPMRATDKPFARAFDFRRFLQKNLRPHLQPDAFPNADPWPAQSLPQLVQLPESIVSRWPATNIENWSRDQVQQLPIDHRVRAVALSGGNHAANVRLDEFVDRRLERYDSDRNQPEEDVTSGLSPYLHFGHLSAHEVFEKIAQHEGWSISSLSEKASGSSNDWWGVSVEAESFLDELITWRELGYNMCWHREDYDQYESLPAWARATLESHSRDPREYVYSLEEFESSQTHDTLWNAAQQQLVVEGRIHNYLRMLWGKKILHWTACPQDALEIMIQLNNRYALDGRNPNSYSGIFWVLGRYDRAWGPERPIFGKIRYMSSKNTARKVAVREYVARYYDGAS